ncbi:MAG: hypothetical protein E7559_00300 [Ruminococcaceae bacterium]|nr:hypothetical protein [Oscillospiraceae bacterium]
MAVTITKGSIKPVGSCVIISNGFIEAAVSVEVGPRIISLRAGNGENLFYVDEEKGFFSVDESLKTSYGKDCYYFFGGHRLWTTPEVFPETYYPDEDPVEWEQTAQGAIFTPPVRPEGLAHKIELRFAEDSAAIEVIHTVTNRSEETRQLALWGITQMRKGGIGVTPQNDRQCAPLANRLMVHWPYNDLNDPRFRTSMKYVTLRQDIYGDGSFKYGINSEKGWGGYIYGRQMFVKRFAATPAQSIEALPYPDYGCNFESYTDRRALEVEALSELLTLKPGECGQHVENWSVIELPGEVPAIHTPEFDAYIDALNI